MRDRVEYEWRLFILSLFLLLAAFGLVGRIAYLGIIKHDFLLDQSNIRSVRDITIPVHRGIITDRNKEPLAISIPVASIWVNPKLFKEATSSQQELLAKTVGISLPEIQKKITSPKPREFVYLKRALPLEKAQEILALKVPGIFSEKGFKRYYPEAEAAAHVVGFTNIDDKGQEGLELAYDVWLTGTPGKKRIVKDRLGNTVTNLEMIAKPENGRDLVLSIDRRVQFLAYNELKNAIKKHEADSGSIVVLSVKTGEVLAMVNMPSYNPNNRKGVAVSSLRNRAVIDVFEPGSTVKAFTIANALDSGKYTINSLVDTNPGVLKVDGNAIYDNGHVNKGLLTVKDVLKKSSDIGVAKLTLSLPSNSLVDMYQKVGFGQSTQSGFPGEGVGVLPDNLKARPFVLATLSFGYSISVTLLQLAQSYAVLASKGVMRPVTFLKVDKQVEGKRVLPEKLSEQVLYLLEAVLDTGGTGKRARVPGYRVAGKTGTSHVASVGGYYKDRHYSSFVGIAPVSDPEFVVAVVIKSPKVGGYHGSRVAAPVFANVMNDTLRVFGVPLDDVDK